MTTNRLRILAEGNGHIVVGVAGPSLHRPPHSATISRRLPRQLRRLMSHAGHEAGFTLVEVIVALAILSIGLSVLLGLISGSLRQTAEAERMAEAGSLAQSLLAEVGTALPIKLEERDGQFPNGY